MRRPRTPRTYGPAENALASALAEVAAAQARTREVEARRQALEAELDIAKTTVVGLRSAAASQVVSLARAVGVDVDVLKVLGSLHGWHEAGTDNCEEYT
jgi:hypothetical protein